MAAGVTDRLWDVEDMVTAWEVSELEVGKTGGVNAWSGRARYQVLVLTTVAYYPSVWYSPGLEQSLNLSRFERIQKRAIPPISYRIRCVFVCRCRNGKANSITWVLNNVAFSSAGSGGLTGSFVHDADNNAYSSVNLTSINDGGDFPGYPAWRIEADSVTNSPSSTPPMQTLPARTSFSSFSRMC